MWSPILLLLILKTCQGYNEKYLADIFEKVNKETAKFNAIAAEIAWNSSVNPEDPDLPAISAKYQRSRIKWQHKTCNQLATLLNRQLLNDTMKRQAFLLCRGPQFTFEEARLASHIYEDLQKIYSNAEVCLPTDKNITITDLKTVEDAILDYLSNVKPFLNLKLTEFPITAKIAFNNKLKENNSFCLKGEKDFQEMMAFSRKEEVLRWLWLVWREKVGPPMKEPYRELVEIENHAVMRSGSSDLGASWREEIEIPNLRQHCRKLYYSVRHLYKLLHAVVRFYLRGYYGDIVPERGPIPAHLLGNLWSQNWEPLANLILPRDINLDRSIKQLNMTVKHMVKRAEDFYQSLGLPAMTDTFWRKSVFTRENNTKTRCHGSAADMFQDGDYRLLYCSGTSIDDFYVLHHELGHIQYYMAYTHQPAIFRQANSALHESIGDSIMYGVLTPQHLHRLGIINDSLLYTYTTDTDEKNNKISTEESDYQLNEPKTDLNIENDHKALHEENYIEKITNYIMKNKKYIHEKDYNENTEEPDLNIEKDNKALNEENYIEKITNYVMKNKKYINEKEYNENEKEKVPKFFDLSTDLILIFKQALNKIPQIPFGLVIDEYRWNYFEGDILKGEENKRYWELVEELQGIAPLKERGEEYFDIGAKFHVPDNTPYIRYFLSSFLQHQIFEKLCTAAVFGQRNTKKPLPDTITLNRCDIYGSKAAGKILKDIMSRGHSQHWSKILKATINESDISASALLRYYRPLHQVLELFVNKYNIPVGW